MTCNLSKSFYAIFYGAFFFRLEHQKRRRKNFTLRTSIWIFDCTERSLAKILQLSHPLGNSVEPNQGCKVTRRSKPPILISSIRWKNSSNGATSWWNVASCEPNSVMLKLRYLSFMLFSLSKEILDSSRKSRIPCARMRGFDRFQLTLLISKLKMCQTDGVEVADSFSIAVSQLRSCQKIVFSVL